MKKVFAVIALAALMFAFSGCAAADAGFSDLQKLLSPYVSETCVYSVKISSDKTGDDETVYTDASSEMVLTCYKQDGALAKVTMESTVKFISTPPYADQTHKYEGLTDTMYSEIVFNGYSADFNPVSVKKSADLQTAAGKSFEAEFIYPVGKEAGQGKYKKAGGGEESFQIKSGKLKKTFDNEQIYYMASSFLSKESSDLKTALGYTKQYKIFNLADYLSYGTVSDSLTFSVAEQPSEVFNGLKPAGEDKFAQVALFFPKGRPLVMYYSLDDVIKVPGKESHTPVRPYLLLGYEQETVLGDSVTKTSFTLKEYSAKKP